MNIKVADEQSLVDLAAEAIHILTNLRHFTKLWGESYGVELKRRKKYWEERSDKLIETLKLSVIKKNETVKIEIDETNKTIL